MIKPWQQFRIDTIEELKEAYENLDFCYNLEDEIDDFNKKGMRYISKGLENGSIFLDEYRKNYQTIPNPFKKYSQPKLTGIDKAIENLSKEARKLGFAVEVIFKTL